MSIIWGIWVPKTEEFNDSFAGTRNFLYNFIYKPTSRTVWSFGSVMRHPSQKAPKYCSTRLVLPPSPPADRNRSNRATPSIDSRGKPPEFPSQFANHRLRDRGGQRVVDFSVGSQDSKQANRREPLKTRQRASFESNGPQGMSSSVHTGVRTES